MDDRGAFREAWGTCAVLSLIVIGIALFSSFSSLQANEVGLDYSILSKQVNPVPFTAGIHFLGVGHSFMVFPKSVITIDFSFDQGADAKPIDTRTSDGLEVVMEISFQYLLEISKIYDIFSQFNMDYNKVFQKIAIDVLTTNATEYSAYNFFMDRQVIGQNMQDALNKRLKECCHASVEFFQLRSVDLPDKFEESIQLTEVEKQSIQRAEAQKNRTIIELETQRKSAEYQKNVTINYAKGDASQIINQAYAISNSTLVVQKQNSLSYKQLKTTLNLKPASLLKFIKSKVIRQRDKNIMISIKDLFDPVSATTTSSSTAPKEFVQSAQTMIDQEQNQSEQQTQKSSNKKLKKKKTQFNQLNQKELKMDESKKQDL